jgi:hypothetical protein
MTEILNKDLWQKIESSTSNKAKEVTERRKTHNSNSQEMTMPQQSTTLKSNGVVTVPKITNVPSVASDSGMVILQPSTTEIIKVKEKAFPDNLPTILDVIMGNNGKPYSVRHDRGNKYVLEIGSRALNNFIREIGQEDGHRLRKADLNDINDMLIAYAERTGVVKQVWFRVAKIEGGIMIDIGDDCHTRVAISAGNVEKIESGSDTLFFRTPFCLPMAMPQEARR